MRTSSNRTATSVRGDAPMAPETATALAHSLASGDTASNGDTGISGTGGTKGMAHPVSGSNAGGGTGTVPGSVSLPPYDPGTFWDEMFAAPDRVRPVYAPLVQHLARLSPEAVDRRQRAAELSFKARGITFAVNQGAEGVEKIMPFDLAPRLVSATDWRRIERGLEQRIRALNLFLHDVYHEQRILRPGGPIPPELVLGARGFRREFRGVDVPGGVYTHVAGSDLVRDGSGAFFVLEDNLRTPSGVSYVVETAGC